jgi:parallel beta-helix repeat protein
MTNGFLTHVAAKNRRNNLKWRVPSAMLAGIALLFAIQGFSRADDDHTATAIATCGTTINQAGRYFLANDLKQCQLVGLGFGVFIAAGHVELELRGHTIQADFPTSIASVIIVDGGAAGISNIEIAGPGTVTGGNNAGIDFENVHRSRVRNLVPVANNNGIDVDSTDITNKIKTSSENEFRDNVVASNFFSGIAVNGGNGNRFIHNNLDGNFSSDGFFLSNAKNDVARQNSADSIGANGINIDPLSSGNTIDNNIALGNRLLGAGGLDLVDQNTDCTQNSWTDNSFNSTSLPCIH